eukprot:11827499-Prorocentrum_lima.AAC.1
MGQELVLKAFIFSLPQVGHWHLWWSLPVLVSALDLDRSCCRSSFIHRDFLAWATWTTKLGFGSGHLRRAAPTEHADKEEVMDSSVDPPRLWRTLPHQAASSPVLLALCIKLATPVRKHRSELEAMKWAVLLDAILVLCVATNQKKGYNLYVSTDPCAAITP